MANKPNFLTSLFKIQQLLIGHSDLHQNTNTINTQSVKKIYTKYFLYFFSLFVLIIVTVFFMLMSSYKESIFFLFLFVLLSLLAPIIFIFNRSLLSDSKFILLVVSYFLTIVSFSLIYYGLHMLSIENIAAPENINQVAFHIIQYDTYEQIKAFDDYWTFLYFSIVTMTTLGYGDIAPLSSLARFATSAEVLLSVFYVVFGIASLFADKQNDAKIEEIIADIVAKKPS